MANDVYEQIPVMENDRFLLRAINGEKDTEDYFNNCGLLRLDLRSDYETRDCIHSILGMLVPKVKEMFFCDKIATKAIALADQRIHVLENLGFRLSDECVIGQDGTRYGSYYVLEV